MKRLLVVNPFGIGDAIFSLVLVEALRQAVPDAVIGFLCNERTVDLVRMDRSIDRTFVFNRDHFRALWKKNPRQWAIELRALVGTVREQKYDALFDLSLGREYAFFAMLAGIRQRVGLNYKGRGLFLTRKLNIVGYDGEPVVRTQLGLLKLAGLPALDPGSRLPLQVPASDTIELNAFLERNRVRTENRILCVAPGGGKSWGPNASFKQWDPHRFAESADAFAALQPGRLVALIGDASEQELLQRTALAMKSRAFTVCGRSLGLVAALLLRSEALLCNDGGLVHLANALGVPTVSLYGPVNENTYGPYGSDTPHRVLTEPVPCRPCYKDFRFPPCPHEKRCLNELPAGRAVAALEALTGKKKNA